MTPHPKPPDTQPSGESWTLYVCPVCGYYWTQEGKAGPSYRVGAEPAAEPLWCPHSERHPDRKTAEVEVVEVIPASHASALQAERDEARAEVEEYHSLTYHDIRDAERAKKVAESLITETVKWCEEEARSAGMMAAKARDDADIDGALVHGEAATVLRSCAAKLKGEA